MYLRHCCTTPGKPSPTIGTCCCGKHIPGNLRILLFTGQQIDKCSRCHTSLHLFGKPLCHFSGGSIFGHRIKLNGEIQNGLQSLIHQRLIVRPMVHQFISTLANTTQHRRPGFDFYFFTYLIDFSRLEKQTDPWRWQLLRSSDQR